jgi:AsmA protein
MADTMTSVGRGRRLATVALLVLAWIVLGMSLPFFFTLDPSEISVRTAAVTAAQRDSYAIAAPVRLAAAPAVVLERGSVLGVAPSREGGSVEAILAMVEAGSGHLLLDGAHLSIGSRASSDDVPPIDATAPLVNALSKGRFDILHIRRSKVSVEFAPGDREILTDVDAELNLKRRNTPVMRGTAQLRGHRFSFTATLGRERRTGAPGPAPSSTGLPIKLTLKSAGLDASLDGRVEFGAGVELGGTADIAVGDLRQLARSLGASWPAGPGLKDLKLSGPLKLAGRNLAFDSATIQIDRNPATGTLSIGFGGDRPLFSGTLAFKSFDLGQYVVGAGQPAIGSWLALLHAVSAASLDMPLLRELDADLRVSASSLSIGSLDLGGSAATITIKSAQMLADIAELNPGNGRIAGQVRTDMAGGLPRVSIRGKIEDLDIAPSVAALVGQEVLSGGGSVTVDLAGAGQTLAGAAPELAGRITVLLPNGGRMAMDPKSLSSLVSKGEIVGLKDVARGQTAFDRLEARLSLRSRNLYADQIVARSGDQLITVTGSVDLAERMLSLTMSSAVASQSAGASGTPKEAQRLLPIAIRGPIDSPVILREPTVTPGRQPGPRHPGG